jgi:transducin (beta)-like 1
LNKIWNQQGESHSYTAHQGGITALVWQPVANLISPPDESERLLASAGEDGAISIWNAKSLDTKSKCSMTMNNGVVGLTFSPDGAFIAGATSEQILIWKVDDVNIPRASWSRGSERGWQTPRSQDSQDVEDQHILSWSADGQTIAFGVNSLVRIPLQCVFQTSFYIF